MLLSALSPAELDALYPPGEDLPRLTDRTITDRAAFRAELAATHERGYALDAGESTVGLHCIAAPVYDAHGRTVAAMSVAVPAPRFTEERVPAFKRAILEGARLLSARLGHSAPGSDAEPLPLSNRDGDRALVGATSTGS
jgi:IclR family acetate operon transcriptional repressor